MATSSDRVYRQIREGILAGDYAVGDRLREGELATQFGVSRTPVRIALQRLVNDRLIDFTAHAGAIVRGYADAEMVEILEIRALLEPQGARLAALNRKQEHLDELFELCARMETLGDRSEPDFGQIAPLNNRFHQVLLDASGQRQLLVVTTSLIELNNVVQSYRKFARADVDRSFAEHRQLATAIERGQSDLAAAIMLSHVHAALANFKLRIGTAAAPVKLRTVPGSG
ncbi:GntR family transcriptional regulator [bacterium SCSIO 12827]|nr:GntR family transcriptional regulator [bacterium SCSIO 12827]